MKKDEKSFIFLKHLIAPCGMNCGTCIAYLREKNTCPGCRVICSDKAVSDMKCIVPNCLRLEKTSSAFCFECEVFPCRRIKNLDQRYSSKYGTSFIENLLMIKEKGLDYFLAYETERRTCRNCGSILSVHRNHCLKCKLPLSSI